ncbi:MAG: hypothetical protein AAGC63_15655 [Propionicimonas sp.]|nr:hypothetical protein [Propionicimonas sp.]
MSNDLFLTGARLRAACTGRPVAVAAYAPAASPLRPVAVSVATERGRVHVEASDGLRRASGTGRAGLAALDSLGLSALDTAPRTLVCASVGAVAALAALAREYPQAVCAPVLDWWDQRVDHPGTRAVLCVLDAARGRWVLGETPEAERELETWSRWLGVTEQGPDGLLALARAATAGPALPGLDAGEADDGRAWDRLREATRQGRPWRLPDTRAGAALALAARSHACEYFASLRLDDPLVARAAVWDGSVVSGTVVMRSTGTLVVRADHPVSRLRVDAAVTGWAGQAWEPRTERAGTGRVQSASVGTDGVLTLTVGDLVARGLADAAPGGRVTLRAARVDPFMHARGRSMQASALFRSGNWIAGRGAAVRRRGDVPMDVVIAAADAT